MELVTWSDFEKIDIRTGTILKAEGFPEARKPAYRLLIDFGPAGIRRSSAQVTQLYTAEELIGRKIVAVINFPPKQVANFISECLVLGAVQDDGSVVLLEPDRSTANGTRVG